VEIKDVKNCGDSDLEIQEASAIGDITNSNKKEGVE
jgi:hypothetical protein